MGRIMAIDYGLKRVGIAVTDPMQIIASPHRVVNTNEIFSFLKNYMAQEEVEQVVVGNPVNYDDSERNISEKVHTFVSKLEELFPNIPVVLHDEQFTSKMAMDAMIKGGTSKKYRREKGNIDKVSAVLILQSYLGIN